MKYHSYSTGDQVWTSQHYGKETVVKVITHDGMVWSEEEPSLKRMEGAEKVIHQITVFCMRCIWKVLNS